MPEDLSTLGFVVDSSGVESGSRRGISALDQLERKALELIKIVDRLNRQLGQGLPGGARSGAAARSEYSRAESEAQAHQRRLLDIQQRAATQSVAVESRRIAQFTASQLATERALARTAAASKRSGDSLSASSTAILAQADALAKLRSSQGDAAGASDAYAAGLAKVAEQQDRVLDKGSAVGRALKATASGISTALSTVTSALQTYTSIRLAKAVGRDGGVTGSLGSAKEILNTLGAASEDNDLELTAKAAVTAFKLARQGAASVKDAAQDAAAQIQKMGEKAKDVFARKATTRSTTELNDLDVNKLRDVARTVLARGATGPPTLKADKLDATVAKLREQAAAAKAATKPITEVFKEVATSTGPAVEAISKFTAKVQDQTAVMSKRAAGDLLAKIKSENDAIVANSLAQQKAAEDARKQADRAQQLRKLETERIAEQSKVVEANRRIRQAAASAAVKEAEQARQAVFARGESQRNAGRAETELRRQAAAAQEAAAKLTAFERLKARVVEFIKDEGGEASFIKGLEGLNRQLGRVRPALNDFGERFLSVGSNARGAAVSFGALIAATGLVVASLAAIGVAAGIAVPLLTGIAQVGIKANSQLEQTKLGIASVISSVGELRDASNVKLGGIEALNAALPIAGDQLEKLRVDALSTALTFEQLSAGFLQAVGPGLAAGLGLDQVRKTVIDISQIIIPLTGNAAQLGQELRSLFSGDIGPDSSVARALQITRQQVEASKAAGTFTEFLNEKLKAAAATGKLMANTFEAAKSNLQEAGTVLAATVTKGLFEKLRDQINTVLPTVFDTAGGKVKIADSFSGLADTLSSIFDRAGDAATAAIATILDGVKGVSAFLTANRTDIERLISGVATVGGAAASAFVTVGGKVAEATAQIILLGVKLAPVLAGLTTLGTLVAAIQFGALARGVAGIGVAFQGLVASMQLVKVALADTAAFLVTTPAGWAILAASVAAAAAAYVIFNDASQDAIDSAAKITAETIKGQGEALRANQGALAIAEAARNSAVAHEQLRGVLEQLDPATRAVVKSFSDEKTQLQLVNEELAKRAQSSKDVLEAQFRVLAIGAAEAQGKIKDLAVTIAAYQEKVRRAQGVGLTPGDMFEDFGVGLAELSEGITDAEGKTNEFQATLRKIQDNLIATAEALKLDKDGFTILAQSVVTDKTAMQGLITAYDEFKRKQAEAAGQTGTLTKALGGQAQVLKDLKLALDNLDVGGVDDKVGKIVDDIAKNASGPKDALKRLREARAQRDVESGRALVDEGIKLKQKVAANKKALDEAISPSSRGASKAENEAKRLREAKREQSQASAEDVLKIAKQEREQILAGLEFLYESGLVSTRKFYAEKLAIVKANINDELKLLNIQEQGLRESRDQAKGAEKVTIQTKINQVLTEQILKTRELTAAERENAREFNKAFGQKKLDIEQLPLPRLNLGKLISKPEIQGILKDLEATREEAEKLAGAAFKVTAGGRAGQPARLAEVESRQVISRSDEAILKLRTETRQVQNAIELGVIGETAGRKALLAIEAKYRDTIINALEAEAKLAELQNDPQRAASIREQIEGYRTIGIELSNAQRFLKGLGDVTDIGDTYERLGQDIRNTFRSAFEAAYEEGPKGFFKALLDGFKKALRDLTAELVTSQFVRLLRNLFQVPGAGGGRAPSAGAQTGSATQSISGFIQNSLGGGGGGNFLTGGFAGGNPAQEILGGGFGGGGGGGFGTPPTFPGGGGGRLLGGKLGGILGKIPGLNKIFDSFGKTAAKGRLDSLPLNDAFGNAIPGSAARGIPGLGASLGAGGLLAGGGLLGSLAGGNSQIGKLLGGVGGTLGAGAIGATGIFGGGLAGALPALFSNPFTAIIAGGLIGGALLFNFLGNRTFKNFQSAVKDEYQVKVDSKQAGKSLFKTIEELGKATFGDFKKNIRRTVQLDEAKELIGQYAESTNQETSSLVQKMRKIRDIGDIGNKSNQFVRRAFGGSFFGGQTVLTGERGPEVIQPGSSGFVFPSVSDYFEKAMARVESRRPKARSGGDPRMAAILSALVEQLSRIGAVPPGQVFMTGAEQSRGQFGRLVREGFAANPAEQREFSQQLGI